MSQTTFFITLLGSLIALGGVDHVALAQPAPDEAPKGVNPPNWGNQAAEVPLNLRIKKPDGTPLAQQEIEMALGTPHGSANFPTMTDAQGRIAIGRRFEPGVYSVYGHVAGIGSGYLQSVNLQQVAGPVTDLCLQSGVTLHITAQAVATDPKPGQVELGRPLGGGRLSLRRLTAATGPNNLSKEVNQGLPIMAPIISREGDGSVEVTNLLPGRYWLQIQDVPGYDVIARELIVTQDAVVPVTMLRGHEAITTLKVTVQDPQAQPLADTDFILRIFGPRNSYMDSRRVHTDTKGEVVLFPVRPGNCTITAWGKVIMPKKDVTIPAEGGMVSLIAQLKTK